MQSALSIMSRQCVRAGTVWYIHGATLCDSIVLLSIMFMIVCVLKATSFGMDGKTCIPSFLPQNILDKDRKCSELNCISGIQKSWG